jgi:hypothetical protein
MEQRSPEWIAARRGWVTCSCLDAVLAKGKGGAESKTRTAYLVKVVCELLTGEVVEGFHNAAMDHGIETEPFGLMAYEVATGNLIEPCGFMPSPDIPKFGGSVDGLIGADGIVELKCPEKTHVHLDTLMRGRMPPEHRPQVQGYLLVTGRAWLDFVSFDPRLPDHLQLYIERIQRDEEYIAMLRQEIARFLAEVDEMVERLNRRAA